MLEEEAVAIKQTSCSKHVKTYKKKCASPVTTLFNICRNFMMKVKIMSMKCELETVIWADKY